MKRTFTTLTMLVAGMLTVSLPNGAFAELTFDQWATDAGYTPPGAVGWSCSVQNRGVTSLDGVKNYTNLQALWLRGNQISSLDADQFRGLTSLQTLDLYNNQISSLHADQFHGLTNLQWLFLSDNQISSLDANPFQGLTNLQLLYVAYNQISSLHPNQFHGLTDLQTLPPNPSP